MDVFCLTNDAVASFSAYIPSNRLAAAAMGRCCAIGAVKDGAAVGAAVLEEDGADVLLSSLTVNKTACKSGVGTTLLQACKQVAQAYGASRMEALYVPETESARIAQAFLLKNGFSKPTEVGCVCHTTVGDLRRSAALCAQPRLPAGSRIAPLDSLPTEQRTMLETDERVPSYLRPGGFADATEFSMVYLVRERPEAWCVVTGGGSYYEVAAVFSYSGKGALAARLLQAVTRHGFAQLAPEVQVAMNTSNEFSALLRDKLLEGCPAKVQTQYSSVLEW